MTEKLKEDKLWAEVHTSEEWARLPEERPLPLPVFSAEEIRRELERAFRPRRPATPHEL